MLRPWRGHRRNPHTRVQLLPCATVGGPVRVRVMPSDVVRVMYRKYDGSAAPGLPGTAAWPRTSSACGWASPAGTASVYHGRPSVERSRSSLLVPRASVVDRRCSTRRRGPARSTATSPRPARWAGDDEVHLVDLDLDVVRRRMTGDVELRDEDEFAEHRVRFGYPDDAGRRRRTRPRAGCSARWPTAPSRSRRRTGRGWPWWSDAAARPPVARRARLTSAAASRASRAAELRGQASGQLVRVELVEDTGDPAVGDGGRPSRRGSARPYRGRHRRAAQGRR